MILTQSVFWNCFLQNNNQTDSEGRAWLHIDFTHDLKFTLILIVLDFSIRLFLKLRRAFSAFLQRSNAFIVYLDFLVYFYPITSCRRELPLFEIILWSILKIVLKSQLLLRNIFKSQLCISWRQQYTHHLSRSPLNVRQMFLQCNLLIDKSNHV